MEQIKNTPMYETYNDALIALVSNKEEKVTQFIENFKSEEDFFTSETIYKKKFILPRLTDLAYNIVLESLANDTIKYELIISNTVLKTGNFDVLYGSKITLYENLLPCIQLLDQTILILYHKNKDYKFTLCVNYIHCYTPLRRVLSMNQSLLDNKYKISGGTLEIYSSDSPIEKLKILPGIELIYPIKTYKDSLREQLELDPNPCKCCDHHERLQDALNGEDFP